jgi:hypothetical protein
MSFPDLDPRTDARQGTHNNGRSTLWAEAEGVPANGDNVIGLPFIGLGINPIHWINEDWLDVRVEALGPSVSCARFVSLAPDGSSVTISFDQSGSDQARVTVAIIHTVVS